MLLESIFIRSVIIPVVFSVICALLNWILDAIIKGRAVGSRKYRIWEWEQDASGNKTLVPRGLQSVDSIRALSSSPFELEIMAQAGVENFAPLAIDFTMTAILIDITSLVITPQQEPTNQKLSVLVIHLFMFCVAIACVALCRACSPAEIQRQKRYAVISLAVGVLSMMGSFLVL